MALAVLIFSEGFVPTYVRHFLFTAQNSTKPCMQRDFHIDKMEKKESVDANAPVNT